jgi:Cu(I)/Ag(I) efflux system membrane fusion protein
MRIFIISLAAALLITACEEQHTGHENQPATGETAIEHAKKHLDAKYVCPMHPEIVRDKPGSCPTCGMFLVKKEVKSEPQ